MDHMSDKYNKNDMISAYVLSKGAEPPMSSWAPLLFQRIIYPGKKVQENKNKKDKQNHQRKKTRSALC